MHRKIDKNRNRKEYISGVNVVRTVRSCKKELKCNEDTIIRTEIRGIIISSIKERKDDKDIINELSQNERYSKYTMYFENWINDMKKKVINKEERQK